MKASRAIYRIFFLWIIHRLAGGEHRHQLIVSPYAKPHAVIRAVDRLGKGRRIFLPRNSVWNYLPHRNADSMLLYFLRPLGTGNILIMMEALPPLIARAIKMALQWPARSARRNSKARA